MRYLPCERCQHDADTCEIRQRVSEGVKRFNEASGQRLTSAKFTCERRLEGFELGARVIVTDREWVPSDNFGGIEHVDTEIYGTVLDHRGRKVELWLDEETATGNRHITIYPTPIGDDHLIGVRSAGARVDVEDAIKDMVREARKHRGEHGDDVYYCPDCGEFSEFLEWPDNGLARLRDSQVCPECGSAAVSESNDFAEKGLLPEQQGKT